MGGNGFSTTIRGTDDVGGVKKGRIFGFGVPHDPQYVMTDTPNSSSQIQSSEQGTSDEVRSLKEMSILQRSG
ncbi:hypothetical protein L6452_27204 [Arctium lappa]|uniref:Uncharacterized protein n=1 Tax=Arctium lappa TaxID=4217 RepID=A0ACB8ZW15_ARCLA|nr:hypothetical protein L6452_27204 [Arctium lappa]